MQYSHRVTVFTLSLAIAGFLYALASPPFIGSDEKNHFFRAYQISEGQLRANLIETSSGKISGGILPKLLSLESIQYDDVNHGRTLNVPVFIDKIKSSQRLSDENLKNRMFLGFPNTALYSPVVYLGQVAAISIGKLFSLKTVFAFYLARLLTGSISLGLIYLALRVLAFSKRQQLSLFFIAGLPMSFLQLFSISADSMTTGMSFLVFALSMKLSRSFEKRTYQNLLVASFFLALCKSLYFLIPLTAIPALWSDPKKRFLRIIPLLFCALFPALLWGFYVKEVYSPLRTDILTSPPDQVQYMLLHPLKTAQLLYHWVLESGASTLTGFIGILGSANVVLHRRVIQGFEALIFFCPLIGYAAKSSEEIERQGAAAPVDRSFKIESLPSYWTGTNIFIFTLSFIAILTGQYCSWNAVGAPHLDGIFGRYFTPISPLLLLLIPTALRLQSKAYRIFEFCLVLIWIYLTGRVLAELVHSGWQAEDILRQLFSGK